MEELPIAAIVGAIAGLLASGAAALWAAYRADLERRREHFANALVAVTEYCEFPYVIRRRGIDDPEGERLRISTELRAVQQRIAFHEAWLRTESDEVAKAYERLVAEMRRVAGRQMHDAWEEEPIVRDADMNIASIERGDIDALREAYLSAVRKRCSWRWWF